MSDSRRINTPSFPKLGDSISVNELQGLTVRAIKKLDRITGVVDGDGRFIATLIPYEQYQSIVDGFVKIERSMKYLEHLIDKMSMLANEFQKNKGMVQ